VRWGIKAKGIYSPHKSRREVNPIFTRGDLCLTDSLSDFNLNSLFSSIQNLVIP
jgi:hypothetical protein